MIGSHGRSDLGLAMRLIVAVVLAMLLGAASLATAEERFPPPDFTDHELPVTTTPAARSLAFEYLDVAFLAVALGLASWLAIKRRSRRGLVLLAAVSLLWLGFWRQGCVCAIGSIQNVALALADPGYAIPLAVLAVFALPLLASLYFGRTFCAAVCPLGALQELTLLKPVKVPAWLEHGLGLLPFVYLGAAVLLAATGTTFIICEYDPYVGFFRLSGNASILVFGAALLLLGLFVGRPYCRFLCPLGAVFGLFSRISRRHLRIPEKQCINCRLCEDACPYGAIRPPTVDQPPAARQRGRHLLAALLLLAPVLVVVGAWLGRGLAVPLAKLDPDFRLAERIRQEESGEVEGTTDASDAFRNTGQTPAELYALADEIRQRFTVGGAWLGAWVGLVIAVKLVSLAVRRRRTEYAPDPALCVSCGRCFEYCPNEETNRHWIGAGALDGSSGVRQAGDLVAAETR